MQAKPPHKTASKSLSSKRLIVMTLCAGLVVLGLWFGAQTLFGNYNAEQKLEQAATKDLYDQAAVVPAKLEELVDTNKPLDQSLQTVPYHMPAAYASTLTASGDVQWDVVLGSRQRRGGGLTYKDITFITCVRYTMSARSFEVTIQPITCPQGSSRPAVLQAKPYDKIITLKPDEL